MDYTWFKLIHLFAVVIFLGNIITGLFWMHIAVKSRDLKIILFTMEGIIKSDRYFTIPGVIIITTAGILAASYGHFPLFRTGWIFWSLILFSISGVTFGFRVAPLQKKIRQLVVTRESDSSFDWTRFNQLMKSWHVWGWMATITPLLAFIMMTLKIPQ